MQLYGLLMQNALQASLSKQKKMA